MLTYISNIVEVGISKRVEIGTVEKEMHCCFSFLPQSH